MKYMIEDFIAATNTATTKEEAFDLYQNAIIQFGLDSAVYTFVTDHTSVNQKAGHGIQCNFPEHWMKHYLSHDYVGIDPVTTQVLKEPYAFTWDSLEDAGKVTKKQIQILNEARESGLHHGVGIPLYGPRGEIAGVGLSSTNKQQRLSFDKMALSQLKLLTEQFHLTYCSLSQQMTEKTNDNKALSYKEIEVLKWWAAGKTADEIAFILNCRKPTIKFHVKNIYIKLNANSKILAVTKAIRLGIIPPDAINIYT